MDRVEVLLGKVYVNGRPLFDWVRSFYKKFEVGTYDWAGMLSRSMIGLLREIAEEKGFDQLVEICAEVDQKHREGYLLEDDFARIALVLRTVFTKLCTAERDKQEWEHRYDGFLQGLVWVELRAGKYVVVVTLKSGPNTALTERGFRAEGDTKYIKEYGDYYDCIDVCSELTALGIKCVPRLFV